MELNEEFISGLSLNPLHIVEKVSDDLKISFKQVKATIDLLKEDNSIPFISRYRKEVTGSLDEVQVRDISHKLEHFENIEGRKIEIVKKIFSTGQLTDDLFNNVIKSTTFAELEDLYAPFKKKKKTRAMIAIEKGLQELAVLMETLSDSAIEKEALKFVDEEKGVPNIEEALTGAMDIIAEKIAHDVDNRKKTKEFVVNDGVFCITGNKDRDSSVYKMYYDFKEPIKQLKPHRILAINRGEREGELELKIDYNDDAIITLVSNQYRISNDYHKRAIADGMTRLMLPAVLREIRSDLFEQADKHGINVFATNLKSLLMQPPIKRTRVMGVDPGIRTGTKAAVLDDNGKFLAYFTFMQNMIMSSKKEIADHVKKYSVELIAIGNGTGVQDVQKLVADAISDYSLNCKYTIVAEDGASVYSASDIAREEFPELDLTIRGAISIGRRIQDPLAELVKIDPKSIGVGLYQHDVNQASLSKGLDEVVESVVNNVGVNVNTASYSLLKYVSGIKGAVALGIVDFRNRNGTIKSRMDLKKVTGLGDKTFEQAAGFLKIPESSDELDNTWVHPENYALAREILQIIRTSKSVSEAQKKELTAKYGVGEFTISDIIEELKKPNRDPREDYPMPIIQEGVVSFEDLKVGMKITGKIKNVVDFGAFVDLGIKETGLLHISQISDNFVSDPHTVLKVGDVKEYSIIEIDTVRRRISLSGKSSGGQAAGQSGNKANKPSSSDPSKKVVFKKKQTQEDLLKQYLIN